MMNNNQQLLNENQQSLDRKNTTRNISRKFRKATSDPDDTTASGNQWDFLDYYGTLFRKSSLILLVTLGREYTTMFHVRDLSRLLAYDVSLVSKNLKELERFGLVNHNDIGNLVFYKANMDNVLLKHIKICFTLMELNELIHMINPVSSSSILYGSCAKGEDTSASDIDLFIETIDKDAVQSMINNYREKIPRTISAVVVTPDEMYAMKMKDKAFFSSIQNGIVLKEGENVV